MPFPKRIELTITDADDNEIEKITFYSRRALNEFLFEEDPPYYYYREFFEDDEAGE